MEVGAERDRRAVERQAGGGENERWRGERGRRGGMRDGGGREREREIESGGRDRDRQTSCLLRCCMGRTHLAVAQFVEISQREGRETVPE